MNVSEKIFNMKDIHQLVEMVSEYLQKAIIIENRNFELIAYSSPNEFYFDPVQQKTILAKRCPLYVIERLKREGIIEQCEKESRPIRLHGMEDIDFYQRVVIGLKHHGKLYGCLWIYETEKLTESDFNFLTDIADHLGYRIFKQQHVIEDTRQTFIWKMMNDEYLNEAEIIQAANLVGYTIPEEFTVIVYSVKDAAFVYVLEKIKALFMQMDMAHYLGKGTEIIGIIHQSSQDGSQVKTNEFVQAATALLTEREQMALYIGIGRAYERFQFMRKSYLEALEVIETMAFLDVEEQSIIHFKDLGIHRYVKAMYKKNVSEQYRNDQLLKLMNKDLENNSELLKTLWYFLKNDCRVAKTAEALFIHPNTLNYRIKQISHMTSINFNDVEEKMELYIQLMLIHLIPDYRDYYVQENMYNST